MGVLGGMGPEATADLYLNIIRRCQKEFGAKYNSDFPQIIINSYPIQDGKMWQGFNEKKLVDDLKKNVKLLEKANVDFIAIPCNSVHNYIEAIRKCVKIPVLSIPEEVTKVIKRKKLKKVALFGTHFTLKKKVFDSILKKNGIVLVKPNEKQQKKIDTIIIRIESGKQLSTDKNTLLKIIRELKRGGIEGVILGCTELPLLINQKEAQLPLFDTIDILAEKSFKLFGNP